MGESGRTKMRLTCDRRTQIDDATANCGVVRAADLAPLAGVE